MLIILLNDFINFASVKYLFQTPDIMICLLFVIAALFIVRKGLETLGRTSLLLSYISIILFVLIVLTLTEYIDLSNIKPILSNGIAPVLKGALYYIAYSVVPILFLSILSKNNDNSIHYKQYNKYLIIGYLISTFTNFIVIFYLTTIYNYEYISIFNYPAYISLKKIEYGFISNSENLLSLFFVIDYFFLLTTLFYLISYYLKKELSLKNNFYKISYALIILVILYISTYYLSDTVFAQEIAKIPYIYTMLIFLFLFLLIVPIKAKLHKSL